MNRLTAYLGRTLARYLERETAAYVSFSVTPKDQLRACLRPGDVLLIEGGSRISAAIKYLTHSTWSHSAFYVGADEPGRDLIEADLQHGVRWVPLSQFDSYNTRICRPVDLDGAHLDRVVRHMIDSVGRSYDLKNVVDLMRYLLPQPPVPRRWRRRMLALGSGDPTRAICSTLIAEAFQSVRYPILPKIEIGEDSEAAREILHIRHHSLFAPRDFDLSPYFRIVKPSIEGGFDFKSLTWGDGGVTAPVQIGTSGPGAGPGKA